MNQKRLTMAVLLLALSACGGGDDDPRDLDRARLQSARQTWAAAGIHDYQFTLRKECFCTTGTTDGAGRFVIHVQDDQVQSASNADNGTPYSQEDARKLPTIDGLVDIIENAYDHNADSVLVEYDATRGFPVNIDLDPIRGAADDETSYAVTDFM